MSESIEVVIFGDCMGDGEPFLRGERRTVSKQLHRQLVAAGRVCTSDEAAEAAEAELAARLQGGAEPPAPPAGGGEPPADKKAKGKAEA